MHWKLLLHGNKKQVWKVPEVWRELEEQAWPLHQGRDSPGEHETVTADDGEVARSWPPGSRTALFKKGFPLLLPGCHIREPVPGLPELTEAPASIHELLIITHLSRKRQKASRASNVYCPSLNERVFQQHKQRDEWGVWSQVCTSWQVVHKEASPLSSS